MRGSSRFSDVPRRWKAAAVGALALAALAGPAGASHLANDTQAHTTLDQTLEPITDPKDGYTNLQLAPGEGGYMLRDDVENPEIPNALTGRESRRASLTYFSQLTDFQLADEESPARVEFVDPGPSSAWRPQEGFTAFQMEATVRQINEYADASPVAQGDGTFNAMDFTLLTGDQADNQQFNETRWVRDLLEGTVGPLNFNSGLDQASDYSSPGSLGPSCAAFVAQEGAQAGATTPEAAAAAAAAEGARYTGVQDYSDYPLGAPPITPLFYDPNQPSGQFADWPEYDGLMDRAQQIAFAPEGLDTPFYVTNGNHDVLVQGNEDANAAFEDIATGCFKALGTTNDPTMPPDGIDGPDPTPLLSAATVGMLVPPDPDRYFVSKPQIKELYGVTDEGPGDDDHGFAYVDDNENTASRGSASYYAWDPEQTPGMRFVSIDTNSEGGQTAESFVPGQPATPGSSNGNIDDPQFQWLKRELTAAKARNQLVVIFGHHPVRSMSTQIRDEMAATCTSPPGPPDEHHHDPNPGCDLDPRPSDDDPATPGFGCIHNGTDAQNNTCPGASHESFEELLGQFSNVVAYVPGHTHEHRLTPFIRPDKTTWWEVNTSAVIDYPNQSRLVEVMDNRDGTLSIFNTVVDHASPATAPEDCPDAPTPQDDCAAGFTEPELASIGRTLTYNDPDNDFSGIGRQRDRNAELLLEDPRPVADLSIVKTDNPATATAGQLLTYTLAATNNGTNASEDTAVTDELPAGVTVRQIKASQGSCTQTGRTVECDLGALVGGAGATVTITVTPQQPGQLSNTATVRGNVSDRDPSDDSDTETTTVVAPVDDGGGDADGDGTGGGGTGGGGSSGGSGGTGGGGNPGGDGGGSAGGGVYGEGPGTVDQRCAGREATIVGSGAGETIRGTPGPDVIAARAGRDRIVGRGGNDVICGAGGKDKLKGRAGKDRLRGGAGNDRPRGGAGGDRLNGGAGRDRMRGGGGFDRCNGGAGSDRLAPDDGCERTSKI